MNGFGKRGGFDRRPMMRWPAPRPPHGEMGGGIGQPVVRKPGQRRALGDLWDAVWLAVLVIGLGWLLVKGIW